MHTDDPAAQGQPDPREPDYTGDRTARDGSAQPETPQSRRALLRAAVAGSVAMTGAGAAAAAAVAPWRPQILGPIRVAFAAASPAPTATTHAGASPTATSPAATPTATATATATTTPAAVTIQNLAFSPAALSISHGTTVTWTNMDGTVHTSTSDTSGLWDSGTIAGNGGTFSFTFNLAPGTYHYHCSIHSFMQGSITVT